MNAFLYINNKCNAPITQNNLSTTKHSKQVNKGNRRIHKHNLTPRDAYLNRLCPQIIY